MKLKKIVASLATLAALALPAKADQFSIMPTLQDMTRIEVKGSRPKSDYLGFAFLEPDKYFAKFSQHYNVKGRTGVSLELKAGSNMDDKVRACLDYTLKLPKGGWGRVWYCPKEDVKALKLKKRFGKVMLGNFAEKNHGSIYIEPDLSIPLDRRGKFFLKAMGRGKGDTLNEAIHNLDHYLGVEFRLR
ncbi:hypothetical protein KY337_04270 [Candidatus Woesearchaeota archaeon]|nr:hypothetical protein [Candidatus Woesearchaeota archaeon]